MERRVLFYSTERGELTPNCSITEPKFFGCEIRIEQNIIDKFVDDLTLRIKEYYIKNKWKSPKYIILNFTDYVKLGLWEAKHHHGTSNYVKIHNFYDVELIVCGNDTQEVTLLGSNEDEQEKYIKEHEWL